MITDKNLMVDALEYHSNGSPGKISIQPSKQMTNQRDLSLAYSPGVAYPCLEIQKNPLKAFDYTAKGNFVAVISNGTAVLGLGNLGALASKPVMEGKAVLFKRFADIDAIDLEVNTEDIEEFVNCVKLLGPSWGGINLEDIKSPECFIIEEKLKNLMDIPVFHDDQHGTAIISLAGIINAAEVTGRDFSQLKIVSNGAGAASIACIELIKKMGVPAENITLCDSHGVIYKGRTNGMNEWKEKHAVETKKRTLAEALEGADVFLGLSVADVVTPEMVKKMAPQPIIFAMANPNPEIKPELARSACPDAIIATGRSDYPNQVNNVMGFPYIFRGALDVRAKTINDEMKIAAALAIAELAKLPVPDQVKTVYNGRSLKFGPDYIIPVPFDPRLIYTIPVAVAKAAMETGVAQEPIVDLNEYQKKLKSRLNPSAGILNLMLEDVGSSSKRVLFADGEEESVIKAAIAIRDAKIATPILVGREEKIIQVAYGFDNEADLSGVEIINAKILEHKLDQYINFLYAKMQRKGLLYRDCSRLVKADRNIFSACLLACNEADALIAGHTRSYKDTLKDVLSVIDAKPDQEIFGLSILLAGKKTILVSDSTVNISPDAETLARIAVQSAKKCKSMGLIPRVAFLSFSNFGSSKKDAGSQTVRQAVKLLETWGVEFEFDGEISADVALNQNLMKLYPFMRLSGPANVLIMPNLSAAHISTKLVQELGGHTVLGPMLQGFSKPVQIIHTGASVEDLVNSTIMALFNSNE